MYKSIQGNLCIELILKILIFRVFWVTIQVYNEIGRGGSVISGCSRYGRMWRIM